MLFLLHDVLADPSASAFVEEGFRQASHWLPALELSPPALMVQPFGRGNAGWLGLGGRDFFDVWGQLRDQFPCDPEAVGLIGIGPGATGALQLACWFPDCFSAVAAIGPWADGRQDLPLGSARWPAWERWQRESVCPCALASNLRNIPVHLEHPWWFGGSGGHTGPEHSQVLAQKLEREGVSFQVPKDHEIPELSRQCPRDPEALLGWIIGQRRVDRPQTFRFKTFLLCSAGCQDVRIIRFEQPGKPGLVRGKASRRKFQVTTKGVQALALRLPKNADGRLLDLRIDGKEIPLTSGESPDDPHWIHLEFLADGWQQIKNSSFDPKPGFFYRNGPKITASFSPSSAMALRWDSVLFVPGSLGDGVENERMLRFAEHLRGRWQSGLDSPNPHPGDRSVAIEFPVRPDVDITDQDLCQHHLVLIGNPRTNLLLARFEAQLPCRWSPATGQKKKRVEARMTIAGQHFEDPLDVAFFVCSSPERPDRRLLVVSPMTTSALSGSTRVNTAFLPDYLVHRAERVLAWGYFDL